MVMTAKTHGFWINGPLASANWVRVYQTMKSMAVCFCVCVDIAYASHQEGKSKEELITNTVSYDGAVPLLWTFYTSV